MTQRSRKGGWLILLVLVSLAVPAGLLSAQFGDSLGPPRLTEDGGAPEPGTGDFVLSSWALRVIDGATLEAYSGDGRFGVGILGVDAPAGNTECGRHATTYLTQLLHGDIVFREDLNVFFNEDSLRMYHLYLSYGEPIAHQLVHAGYAYASHEGRYATELAVLQAEAESAERGCLWGDEEPFEVEPMPSFGITAANLPNGFESELVVGGLTYPSSFAFLPNGDMLIGENSGLVRLFSNGQLQSAPFIDIRSQVNDYWDRGLLSIAVDPNYESNGYVYLYYTYENDPRNYTGRKTGRLIRVTSNGTSASHSSAVTLLGTVTGRSCNDFAPGADCIPSDAPSHSAGDLRFALDGSLFVTVGDGAHFNTVVDDALRAQNMDLLAGKVLRINPGNGQGLPDNPFWNGNAQSNRSKIWGSGLRNAYRMDIHPGTDIPYVGDVGWNSVEEINVALSGANMGWPCYEGSSQQPGYSSYSVCQNLYSQGTGAVQPPLIEWHHNGSGAAATAGIFYTADNYPEQYHGAFFYADYVRSWIRTVQVDQSHNVTGGPSNFAVGADGPVDFELGPDGNVYYLAIYTGEIRRIRYVDDSNEPPPIEGDIVYLSDLEWLDATNGWGPVERDMSNGELAAGDGRTMSIQGVTYEKGLGVHAVSEITYALDGSSCSTFVSDIGVDDYVGSNGSVTFEVWTDGNRVYQSSVLTGSHVAETIQINIEGVTELRLRVGDGGDNIDYDHANWADARLLCGGGEGGAPPPPPPPPPPDDEVVYLSDLEWEQAINGWGPVERDMSNGEWRAGDGQTMSIQGVTYEKGLGVHAVSDIIFALDGSCHTFLSDVGIDDYVGSNGSVTFEVRIDGQQQFQSGVLTGSDAAQHVEVDIEGASELRLFVSDGGDNIDYDHANWADARLLCGESRGEEPLPGDDPPPAEALEVIETSPGDGAIDITPDASISAVFSIAMEADSISSETVTLAAGDDNISASVSYDRGSRTAILTPQESLALDTSYTVTIHGGETGVRNELGIALEFDYTWAFTTAAEPDDPPPPPDDEVVYLSDLEWEQAINGLGPVERDVSNGGSATGDGRTMSIQGVTYEKGLGVHAISDVVFALEGSCHTFRSDVGVDDEVGNNRGSVTFEVWVDGQRRFQSGLLRGRDAAQAVEIDITGAIELRLYVGDGGNNNRWDSANWADAHLLCGGSEQPLALGGHPQSGETLQIQQTHPEAGVADVATDSTITVTFAEAMDPDSVTNETVWISDQNTENLPMATVVYDSDDSTIILSPDFGFDHDADYTVTIRGGEHGVRSDQGATLESDYSWSFTTEDDVQLPDPSLLSEATYHGAGANAHSVVADDVNGDGILDLIVANAGDNSVSILFGTGNGTFSSATDHPVGAQPRNAVTGDFNNNGLRDIVSANQGDNTVSVLLAIGGGSYAPRADYPACVSAHEVKTGDFNGDGNLDLAVACADGDSISVLLGNGDGTFQEAVSYEVGSSPRALVVRDFNGNGINDLAVANHGSDSVSLLLGNGDGTFASAMTHSSGSGPYSIDSGDFNSNGFMDLVVANNGGDSVSVLLGNGDGTFQPQITYVVGSMPTGVRVGDLTGNGILDIVAANTFHNQGSTTTAETNISVLQGNGDGTFQAAEVFEVNITPFAIVLADLNGNGRLDVATANWNSGNVGILFNQR